VSRNRIGTKSHSRVNSFPAGCRVAGCGLSSIRSGLIGPYETILADVVALKLGELRFLRPGGYRSVTAHADGIECFIVILPVVERRHG
jgi:hypothetical protein